MMGITVALLLACAFFEFRELGLDQFPSFPPESEGYVIIIIVIIFIITNECMYAPSHQLERNETDRRSASALPILAQTPLTH